MRVPTKHIQSTQVDGENFQILKITIDKCVLHSEFYSLDMNGADVVQSVDATCGYN